VLRYRHAASHLAGPGQRVELSGRPHAPLLGLGSCDSSLALARVVLSSCRLLHDELALISKRLEVLIG